MLGEKKERLNLVAIEYFDSTILKEVKLAKRILASNQNMIFRVYSGIHIYNQLVLKALLTMIKEMREISFEIIEDSMHKF